MKNETTVSGFKKVLSRDEMKQIMGGFAGGTCQAQVALAHGGFTVLPGLSAAEAQHQTGMVHWCCDSCASTSWALAQA